MIDSSNPGLSRWRLPGTAAVVAGAWLVAAIPALAQGEATGVPDMTERFFSQPDLAAPLVIPMILALGGIVTLLAFLAWVIRRMPGNSGA